MGSSDSLSFPSEPPDVGNWFASYSYESPVLNSADDFHNWRCSEQAEIGDGKECRRKDFPEFCITRKRGVSLDHERTTSNEFIPCERLGGLGNCEGEVHVSEIADSLSQFSEPSDVKNWFSIYIYESPALDTLSELRSHPSELGIEDEENNDPNSSTPKKDEPINNPTALELGDFGVQIFSSDALNRHSGEKECHQSHFAMKNCRNKNLALHNLDKENCAENCCDLRQDVEKSNSGRGSSPGNFNDKVEREPIHLLFSVTGVSESNKRSFPRKLFESNDPTDESFKHEASTEGMDSTVPAENMNLKLDNKRPYKQVTGGHDIKEIDGHEYAESGFISTRKSIKRAEDENCFGKPFKDNVAQPPKGSKEATSTRKVLSETTNFQVPQVLGITGKWKCPQKSKPYLGPPLKQLRLERWVRRV